jgi:hypothetical protein
MSCFELSISPDYVSGWGLSEAAREIFQNAIDQQTMDYSNKMFFEYEAETETLIVGSKKSILKKGSLLLGCSSKSDDPRTIGQFGEGYKVATAVLLRLGKTLEIHNYAVKELWVARIKKSRRYGSDIVCFDVTSRIWSKVPDNNLTFVIGNITPEEYNEIYESNLHLQEDIIGEVIETSKGRILLNERYAGKVFVGGLFVGTHTPYVHGYDFKPGNIKLDRDRKLVSNFDLDWLASSIWSMVNDSNLLVQLIKDQAADVKYIVSTFNSYSPIKQVIATTFHDDFVAEYGEDATPVTDQSELQYVNENTQSKPIIVNAQTKELIKCSNSYKAPIEIKVEESPIDRLQDWYDRLFKEVHISLEYAEEFEEIMELLD